MNYDTPLSSQSQQLSKQPLRLQMKAMAKDTGMKSFRSAKNFGIVGAIFAGTECCIEGVNEYICDAIDLPVDRAQ